jgi:glucose/arabinose dehydrogenase
MKKIVFLLCTAIGTVMQSSGFVAAQSSAKLTEILSGLDAPIALVSPDDGTNRRFVVDQTGIVLDIEDAQSGDKRPFLDIRDRLVSILPAFDERGLWSIAFHPDFASNGRLFVTYSAKRREHSPYSGETAYTWRLSEFKGSADNPDYVDTDSENVLIEIDWINRKHNGGGLTFGKDGMLYVGIGDGGGVHGVPDVYVAPQLDEDALRNAAEIKEDPYRLPETFHHYDQWAQDLGRLHGKILRIDVDAASPYAIPASNPFSGAANYRPEIWAWGFRNPFRLSVDSEGAGDIIVSGVAETLWEAVYVVSGPGNFGWPIKEGTHCFDRERAFDPPVECAATGQFGEPLHDPAVEYPNWSVERPWSKVDAEPLGTATVGGFVYRGAALPAFYGKMIIGDFSLRIEEPSGQILMASPTRRWRDLWEVENLITMDQRVHSLGQDSSGELYVLTTAQGIPTGKSGKVWKLEPKTE